VKTTLNCHYCNTEVYMPFRCPYCGNYFCPEHRMPENHKCPEIWKAKKTQPETQTTTPLQSSYQHTITTYAPVIPKRGLRFSTKELQHITIGAALVMAVGVSITLGIQTNIQMDTTTQRTAALTLAALFTASFLLHELAHKTIAQRYGLWAEFRLTLWGALITLISIFSPLFKLISPGAVMISGSFVDKKIMGKTAIAGPATNIILATILGTATMFALNSIISFILLFSAYINAFLATFNLIPFGILDGHKIFFWNKLIWALAFTTALALTIPTAYFLFR
jgi:Zn-dependent protease